MYQQLEFGKRAMMRTIFSKASGTEFDAAVAEEEAAFDAKLLGKPPPGSSQAKKTVATKGWLGDEGLYLGVAGLFLAISVGFGSYLFYYVYRGVMTDEVLPNLEVIADARE